MSDDAQDGCGHIDKCDSCNKYVAALEGDSAILKRDLGYEQKALLDAVRIWGKYRDALADLVCQFAYWSDVPPKGGLTTGGLSALQEAFDVMGWTDPQPRPDLACDEPGCDKQGSCGTPDKSGAYRRVCGVHFKQINDASEAK